MESQKTKNYKQVKGMKISAEDINHYNRQEINHPDRSYKYLITCVERQLRIKKQEHNRDALTRGLANNPNPRAAPARTKAAKKAARKAEEERAAAAAGRPKQPCSAVGKAS